MNQPDDFFRKKLYDHSAPPPDSAWKRIESNLDQPRRPRVWAAAAVAILVVTAAAALVYPHLTPSPANPLAHKSDTSAFQEPKESAKANDTLRHTVRTPQESPPPEEPRSAAPSANVPTHNGSKGHHATNKFVAHDIHEQDTPETELRETDELAIFAQPHHEEKDVDSAREVEPERVTIVFSTEEVNAKYLVKNETRDATSETETASGIEKVLNIARDLKNNHDPIGELRQKKNALFAAKNETDKFNHKAY